MMRQMMTRSRLGVVAGLVLAAAAAPAAAQERQTDDSFRWSGRVTNGAWLNVRNLNGSVRVESGGGDEVQVRATKTWRRGDPADVRIAVSRYGPNDRDVLVCAIWGSNTVCSENEYRTRNDGLAR